MRILDKLNRIECPGDLWLVLRIASLSSLLPLLLRWVSLPILLKLLEPPINKAAPMQEEIEKIVYFTKGVLNRNILAGKNTCLKRSLLIYRFLGMPRGRAAVHLGISKETELKGHSWLTIEGKVYPPENVSKFTTIFSY
jgi:Transglutaminase-like superfamily